MTPSLKIRRTTLRRRRSTTIRISTAKSRRTCLRTGTMKQQRPLRSWVRTTTWILRKGRNRVKWVSSITSTLTIRATSTKTSNITAKTTQQTHPSQTSRTLNKLCQARQRPRRRTIGTTSTRLSTLTKCLCSRARTRQLPKSTGTRTTLRLRWRTLQTRAKWLGRSLWSSSLSPWTNHRALHTFRYPCW